MIKQIVFVMVVGMSCCASVLGMHNQPTVADDQRLAAIKNRVLQEFPSKAALVEQLKNSMDTARRCIRDLESLLFFKDAESTFAAMTFDMEAWENSIVREIQALGFAEVEAIEIKDTWMFEGFDCL